MHDHHGDTPEQEIAIAQQAFAQGDLQHAIHHVASALASDATNQQWIGLMDQILRRAPDPLALVPIEGDETDFGTAATRAYACALRGMWPDALSLIAQVVGVRPDIEYLAWVEMWFQVPGVAQMPLDVLMPKLVIPLVQGLPQADGPNDPCLKNLRRAAKLIDSLRQMHPEQGFLWYASSVLARRMGDAQAAIPLAQQGLQAEPTFLTAIGYACALRDAGMIDQAAAAFAAARRYDADDVSTYLDTGDMFLKAKRYAEAAQTYQAVLAKDANHPWALSSFHYATFRQSSDPRSKAAVVALRDRFPFEERVRDLADELDPEIPYHNWIPLPGDATAKALADAVDQIQAHPDQAPGTTVTLNVTHPESPSVLTAFRMDTAHVQPPVKVELKYEKIQQPDPRAPKGQVDFVAWQYRGNEPVPTVGPPPAQLAEALANLAASPFNLDAWEAQAQALAQQLEPGWIPSLVGAMVHPPAKKLDVTAFLWVQRVQVAAALVIGQIGGGWPGSPRERALKSLALGPVDWTTSAALVALGRLGKSDATIRKDVEQLFIWLESQIPQGAFTCFEYPLVNAWIAMGPHDEATRRRLVGKRMAIEHGLGSDIDERYEGLTLEQYAEFCVERDLILARHAQAQGFGSGMAAAAMQQGGPWPELQQLCTKYGVTPKTFIDGVGHVPGADSAAVYEWDYLINGNRDIQHRFMEAKRRAELRMQGIDPDSEAGRVAQRIRAGVPMDLEAEQAKAAAAQQQLASGGGGDADPVVFPGQKLAKLSDYVGFMKMMQQTGDMMGTLARYGLDIGLYGQVAQAWGVKLASDPGLNAKFAKLMAG
jgi:tetratricopeptide (TPR) repeat protein